MATRIWLGIPTFHSTPAPLCPCGSPIDPNGDHLLGCGHGPWRIRRHDSLRDIIYQALLVDNTSVRKEQRVSGHSKERPGDIFHPTFSDSRPTYFDVSIRSPLNPGNVNLSSSSAGSAGLQGEVEKDAKHADQVENAGGVFVPLIVEVFGLWTPFARKTLRQIATRTTTHSGLSVAEATSNLIQQLSVSLWASNAKMLLHRLSLLPSDSSE